MQLPFWFPRHISIPNLQPATCKYSGISFTTAMGQRHHFVDVIHEIMTDETLTPREAVDAMRHRARRSTWNSSGLIEQCISEYITLDPRFAAALPQSSEVANPDPKTIAAMLKAFYAPPPEPRGIDRYLPQPPPAPQPNPGHSTSTGSGRHTKTAVPTPRGCFDVRPERRQVLKE